MKYVTRKGGSISVRRPPATGSVSSKRAWNACFDELLEVIAEQAALIRELRQLPPADRAILPDRLLEAEQKAKPKGGRTRLPDETVKQIEEALAVGQSTR